jgi:hypothetical protein
VLEAQLEGVPEGELELRRIKANCFDYGRQSVYQERNMKCTQCERKAFTRGLCQPCYRQARKAEGFTPAKRGRRIKKGSNGWHRHLADKRRVAMDNARTELQVMMAGVDSVPCVSLHQVINILTE